MHGRLIIIIVTAALLLIGLSTPASAQTRDGRLSMTVVDQTGGVLPGAIVTIAGQDDYAIKAEFSGFEPRVHPDVRIRRETIKKPYRSRSRS